MSQTIEKYRLDLTNLSEVYIFGAGKVGQIVLDMCKKANVFVRSFLVSDTIQNRDYIEGLPVIQSNDAQVDKDIPVLIAVLERGEKKIRSKLKMDGYKTIISCPSDILEFDINEYHRAKSPIIEVTSRIGCKVNCRYCPQNKLMHAYFKTDSKRKSNMSLEDFIFYIGKCPQNTIVDFSGFVEPFLNEDSVQMMEYATNNGYETTLFTTLVGLNRETAERVLQIPFKYVCLHLPDKNGYATIPITEEYLSVLRLFIDAKKVNGDAFIDDANSQDEVHPDVIQYTKGKLKVYCELTDRAGNLDGNIEILSHKKIRGAIICSRAPKLNHNVLLPDGSLALCCNDFGIDNIIGNLCNQTYEEIMSSPEVKKIKSLMSDETDESIICRKCVFAHSKDNEKGK